MSRRKDPYYVELYIDINVNVETFSLDDEEKEELREHLERWWRDHQKEDLVAEGRNKVFLMKLRDILEDDD